MGNIKIGDLKVRDFNARQVSAAVRASKGELEISRLMSTLYQGTLSGKVLAKADNSLSAQLSLDNVEMGAFLHDLAHEDRLAGLGSAKLDLTTRGTTPAALRAGLDGTVALRVRDGVVRGINVAQTLREADEVIRNVFSGQLPEVSTKLDMSRRTDFSALDADVQFQQGQGAIRKLSLVAPLVRVSEGKPASLDLVNEQMDVVLDVRLVNTKTGQDGKMPEELKDVTVPVRLSGPFDNPAYQVQWKEIRSQAVKQAVQDGLLDLLSRKLQPGEAAPQPGAAEPVAPQPSKPADAVKSIGEALKGLLGK